MNTRVLFALHSRSGTDGIHEEIVVITGCFPHSETSKTLAGDELALMTWSVWCRKRLVALAAQKFVSDIAADAYQHARIRTNATASGRNRGPLGAGQSARVCWISLLWIHCLRPLLTRIKREPHSQWKT